MNTSQPFELVACTCVHCGVSFHGHFRTLYCSERCRLKQRRIRQAQRRQGAAEVPAAALEAREWNGTAIQRRRADGYVNATAMCKANGKHLPHYMANERTRQYLQALSGSVGIPTDLLVQSTVTGSNDQRGTWVHPRVAVDMARWLAPDFAVWMDGWFLQAMAQGQPTSSTAAPKALPQGRPNYQQHRIDFDSITDGPRPTIRESQLERVEIMFDWIRNLLQLRSDGFNYVQQWLLQDALLTLGIELHGQSPEGVRFIEQGMAERLGRLEELPRRA